MGKARVNGQTEEQLRRDKLNAAKIVREVRYVLASYIHAWIFRVDLYTNLHGFVLLCCVLIINIHVQIQPPRIIDESSDEVSIHVHIWCVHQLVYFLFHVAFVNIYVYVCCT